MEENREPTPPRSTPGMLSGAAAPPLPPAPPGDWAPYDQRQADAPVTAGGAPPAAPQVGALGMAARLIRLLLLRLLAGLALFGRALRPHVGWLAVLGVLSVVILVQTWFLVAPQLFRSPTGDLRVAAITPPQAVINFLEGQSTYNADLMWEAFSPEFQANLMQRGASKESIAAQVEDERLAGRRYGDVSYIGGIQLGDRSRYYYVVDIDSPQPEQAGSFSFIFTVNRDGKIVGVQRE